MRILVVDDDPGLLELLELHLSELGHETVGVGNGPDALAEADLAADVGRPYRAALVDVNLPGMSGVVLVSELMRRHPSIWVLMCSALTAPFVVQACVQAGCRGWLRKPFSSQDIEIALCFVPGS